MVMHNPPRQLYSVYRTNDDALICFELTADKCAEILGITKNRFYGVAKTGTTKWYVIKERIYGGNA